MLLRYVCLSLFQPVYVPLCRLHKYVEVSQLPEELGGTWSYSHNQWIEKRLVSAAGACRRLVPVVGWLPQRAVTVTAKNSATLCCADSLTCEVLGFHILGCDVLSADFWDVTSCHGISGSQRLDGPSVLTFKGQDFPEE